MRPVIRMVLSATKTRRLLAMAIGAAVVLSGTGALAADFPARPIRLILGFGTGGPTDIIARTLADQLTKIYGERAIVENITGASGNIATKTAVGAEDDGYTYLVAATPLAVNETLFPDLKVTYGRDLVAVAPIGGSGNVLVVPPSLNVHTVAEFVARARSKPDAVSYATVGVGSSSHLSGLAFDRQAGSKMLAVSYRGGGDALKDLLAGRVDAWFAPTTSVLGSIEAGQLVALATTAPERSALLPNVPTIAESGFKDFNIRLWVGVFARPTVPKQTLQSVEGAIARAMQSPDMQGVLKKQDIAPMTMSRDEFDKFVAAEVARWGSIVATMKQ